MLSGFYGELVRYAVNDRELCLDVCTEYERILQLLDGKSIFESGKQSPAMPAILSTNWRLFHWLLFPGYCLVSILSF